MDMTYDDVTGAIASLHMVVQRGHLTVTVTNPPRQPIVHTYDAPADQVLSIPPGQGYTLTLTAKGRWAWQGALQAAFAWVP